jgi:BirA family biotin operon repressor/biotin-[acetyl-CoA-carboxylase] ligase
MYFLRKKMYLYIICVLLSANSITQALYYDEEKDAKIWYGEEKDAKSIIKRQHYMSIPSTQILSREEADAVVQGTQPLDLNHWKLITADGQTAAIGQHSRTWFAPADVNIYATYTFAWPVERQGLLYHLPQTVTLSVAETIEKLGFSPQIKWVNDVLLSEKKMCGVLCESKGQAMVSTESASSSESGGSSSHVVVLVGIGVNVNMSEEQCSGIDQPVTSLKIESGKDWDKEEILSIMNEALFKNFYTLVNKSFEPLYPELQKRMAYIGQEITVEDAPNQYTGIFEGINNTGTMLLRVNGEIQQLHNGRIIKHTM